MRESRLNRVLLTGAAGALGRTLREKLKAHARTLRLSDRVDFGPVQAQEEVSLCDLADKHAVIALLEGVDAVVHLGGVSVEGPFEPILQSNIIGVYNLYEGARIHSVKRIIFASSNHATGFYRQGEVIDTEAPMRPDGYYGISKCFGENLSRFYFDRYGIETVCLRIGSSFPEPRDRRMLTTWLSYDDLAELIRCALFQPGVGHTVIYGVSANRDRWWDNAKAGHLGFAPGDSAERFRAKIEAATPLPDPKDPMNLFQGGAFVRAGPFEN